MFVAALFFTFNFILNVFVNYRPLLSVKIVIILGQTIDGFGNGVLWIARGRYLHLICEIKDILAERGQTFGRFQFLYNLSFLGAALLTFIFLGFVNMKAYFISLSVLGLISCVYCYFQIREIELIGKN